MWPSTELANIAMARFRSHRHPHRFEHLRYEGAGHLITVPGASPPRDDPGVARFKLGGSRERDEAASQHAWPTVLAVLRDGLALR